MRERTGLDRKCPKQIPQAQDQLQEPKTSLSLVRVKSLHESKPKRLRPFPLPSSRNASGLPMIFHPHVHTPGNRTHMHACVLPSSWPRSWW